MTTLDSCSLQTASKVIKQASFYDVTSMQCMVSDDHIVTSQYATVQHDVLAAQHNTAQVHLYAVSATFNLSIQSYIPPFTAIGWSLNPYNTLVAGHDVSATQCTFTLMWSTTQARRSEPRYTVNHRTLHLFFIFHLPITVLTPDFEQYRTTDNIAPQAILHHGRIAF